MNKIQRLSSVLKYIFCALLVLYPLFEISAWFLFGMEIKLGSMADSGNQLFSLGISFGFDDVRILHDLIWQEKFFGFLVQLVPNLLTVAVIYCLFRLFSLYEQGKIFVVDSSRYIKKVGFLLLVKSFVSPLIFHPLLQYVLTMKNPVGDRYFSIMFGSANLHEISVALLVILISWMMTEASKINEEQELTV